MIFYRLLFITLLFICNTSFAKQQGGNDKAGVPMYASIDMANANAFAPKNTATLEVTPSGVEVLKNVSFGILLGTFSYPLSMESEYCKKIRDILIVTQTDMGYIYSIGSFGNYRDAETYRQELVKQGYENANIISFYKDAPLYTNIK